MDQIPVCVAYETEGKRREHFPNITRLEHSKPIYEYVKGWNQEIDHIRSYEDLPEATKQYVDTIERLVGVPITLVSNGPKREQILHREPKL